MANDPESIFLHPTNRTAMGPFTFRRYAPQRKVERSLIVLDDELIGDAAISATRARTIDGTINGFELILVGFGVDRFGSLHRARGRYLTHDEHDLTIVGMPETGEGEFFQQFIVDNILPLTQAPIGLLGYSLSGAFAIELFAQFEMIDRVGLISPSLWIDDGLAGKLSFSADRRRGSGIFLTVGGHEIEIVANDGKTMCEQINEASEQIGQKWGSHLDYRPIAAADHTSIISNAMDLAITFFKS